MEYLFALLTGIQWLALLVIIARPVSRLYIETSQTLSLFLCHSHLPCHGDHTMLQYCVDWKQCRGEIEHAFTQLLVHPLCFCILNKNIYTDTKQAFKPNSTRTKCERMKRIGEIQKVPSNLVRFYFQLCMDLSMMAQSLCIGKGKRCACFYCHLHRSSSSSYIRIVLHWII